MTTKAVKATKPTNTVKPPSKPRTIKPIVPTQVKDLSIDVRGVIYKYQPQPDLTPVELSNIVIMFMHLLIEDTDATQWLKDKNLLRHFRKQ